MRIKDEEVNKLKKFYEGWQTLADDEQLRTADIKVGLPYIMYDICEVLEIDPNKVLPIYDLSLVR